jgi:hypothetical protein
MTALTDEGRRLVTALTTAPTYIGNPQVMSGMSMTGQTTCQQISDRLLELDAAFDPTKLAELDRIGIELSQMDSMTGNAPWLEAAAADGPILAAIVEDLVRLEGEASPKDE